ncbi:sensor histidine kinase [Propionivibrio limicola]|uniref:sensor histidine kinase n=1 Tax=Propionivibrio limicola TaxID=167645 RepID=UPI0012922193|nr:ATP-binding protein [Propionivibrio limicola]
MVQRTPFRRLLLCLALAVLVAASALVTFQISQRLSLADLQATGRHRLDLYAASLERSIDKYAYFPATLGLESDVIDLLSGGATPRLADKVNRYLEQLNERAGTLAIYVIDLHGHVRASSNWQRSDSFVGEDLSFRAYFRDAIDQGNGRFFGIGTTRSEPGYYLSSALSRNGRIVGVAVIKVSLEQLEESWATAETPVLVADENGIVILSSVPDWKFTALRRLDETTRATFDRTQQYNRRALPPLGVNETASLDKAARLVRIDRASSASVTAYPVTGQFLIQSQPLAGTFWSLNVFSHIERAEKVSTTRAAGAGVTMLLFALLGLMLNERRRLLKERLAAREALQKAHDELERKVEERTLDLSATNQQLQTEIAERVRAEQTLRAAQDELIQAGKLAVIGQLSAGIVHELNQPLAALRTLSGNAVRFLERGNEQTARDNLERIGQLVDRMGQITGQLKAFARKSSGKAAPVDLRQVVANAIALLEQRFRTSRIRLTRNFPDTPLTVLCDGNRLEQVIINLIGNALDAMLDQPEEQRRELGIEISAEISSTPRENAVRLTVRDHGPGLSPEAIARLFEPFFTTKDAGVGLGLGLAISTGIVNDYGGTLSGENHPDGGAVFILTLPLTIEDTGSEQP